MKIEEALEIYLNYLGEVFKEAIKKGSPNQIGAIGLVIAVLTQIKISEKVTEEEFLNSISDVASTMINDVNELNDVKKEIEGLSNDYGEVGASNILCEVMHEGMPFISGILNELANKGIESKINIMVAVPIDMEISNNEGEVKVIINRL